MPSTSRSALKRLKQSEKSRSAHKARRSEILTVEKKLREAAAGSDPKATEELFRSVSGKLDKAVKGGTIHKNKADRKKSQLAALIKKTGKA